MSKHWHKYPIASKLFIKVIYCGYCKKGRRYYDKQNGGEVDNEMSVSYIMRLLTPPSPEKSILPESFLARSRTSCQSLVVSKPVFPQNLCSGIISFATKCFLICIISKCHSYEHTLVISKYTIRCDPGNTWGFSCAVTWFFLIFCFDIVHYEDYQEKRFICV